MRVRPRIPRDVEEVNKLQQFRQSLMNMPQPYLKAAAAIERIIEDSDNGPPPPKLWLDADSEPRTAVQTTRNKYYEHLPDTSWNLLVTSHRGRTPTAAPHPVAVVQPLLDPNC